MQRKTKLRLQASSKVRPLHTRFAFCLCLQKHACLGCNIVFDKLSRGQWLVLKRTLHNLNTGTHANMHTKRTAVMKRNIAAETCATLPSSARTLLCVAKSWVCKPFLQLQETVLQCHDCTGNTTFSITTIGRSTIPRTIAIHGTEQRLTQALDNMRHADPPVPFAMRWQLLQERVHGGQALVQVSCSTSPACLALPDCLVHSCACGKCMAWWLPG